MPPRDYYCTDPSHPPIFRVLGQKTLHKQMRERVSELQSEHLPDDDTVRRVRAECAELLARPSDYMEDGYRVQGMRRDIARTWSEVFHTLDNIAYLAGYTVLASMDTEKGNELHFVQSLLSLEAIRTVLAALNQLRAAMASETLGYLRTLHEISVKSRFLARFAGVDADLPGKFSYFTNSAYLDYFLKFGGESAAADADSTWATADRFFADRYPDVGKGPYGWAYPHVVTSSGTASRQPTFRDLMESVDCDMSFRKRLYAVSSSKMHAQSLFGTSITATAAARVVRLDPYSTGDIDWVLELLLPLFAEIIHSAERSTSNQTEATLMALARSALGDLELTAAEIGNAIGQLFKRRPDSK